jgi:hypothetical protein
MKKILAALLAVIAICSVSRADQILIYVGRLADHQNDATVKHYGYFYIFDMSTAQFEDVIFGPVDAITPTPNKYYSTGTTTPFIYSPVTQKGSTTQTYFLYTSSTTGTPFAVNFGDFQGRNVAHGNLGGTFSGEYPENLILKARTATGDGTLPNDDVHLISGVFHLAIRDTRDSNTSNDDMAGAVTVVTDALEKSGYTPE